ncbi:MAG: CAP domain-containing protein, partial [Cytophagales bacterium]|nr:CAP domain-containing protein [Cytophagales bacterium]
MRFRLGKAKSVWRFLSFVAGLGLAHGQTPTSPATPSTLNTAYLEHLVKAQIDSMRRAKDLPALVSDSVLYVSAKDHVDYLAGQPTTSVNQKQNNKRTAQDRAYFHGGRNYLVDENVLSFPLGKTYIETARRIAQTWSRSGRAMRNITETDFQVTGVAIAPHPQDGRFIVVQDFARVLWKYTFANNPRLFPYDTVRRRHAELFAEAPGGGKQKLPWKLKPLDYKRTHKNSIWQSFRKEKLHLQSDYANRVIFARSLTPMEMLQAMQNRRDGLAVELVDFNSYNCNSSTYYTAASRRNGASSVNGRVLKPVYKQELLQNLRKQKRAFRKDKAKRQRQLWFDFSAKARREKQKLRKETWKPEYTSVPVGSLMNVDSSGYVVANFLLLHKKRIIGAVHYTDVCGDLSFTDSIAFEPRLPQHQLNFKDDDRTFEFRVPFARNQAVPDHQVMLAIRDTLRNHQIDQITINAFASVEGMGGLNEKLYRQRADSIVGYLRRYIDEHTDIDVRTGENWTMFYQQIADSASHPWKDLATDQIKRELQKLEVLQAWEARLAEQRQAHVRLETHLQVRDTLA